MGTTNQRFELRCYTHHRANDMLRIRARTVSQKSKKKCNLDFNLILQLQSLEHIIYDCTIFSIFRTMWPEKKPMKIGPREMLIQSILIRPNSLYTEQIRFFLPLGHCRVRKLSLLVSRNLLPIIWSFWNHIFSNAQCWPKIRKKCNLANP